MLVHSTSTLIQESRESALTTAFQESSSHSARPSRQVLLIHQKAFFSSNHPPSPRHPFTYTLSIDVFRSSKRDALAHQSCPTEMCCRRPHPGKRKQGSRRQVLLCCLLCRQILSTPETGVNYPLIESYRYKDSLLRHKGHLTSCTVAHACISPTTAVSCELTFPYTHLHRTIQRSHVITVNENR